MSKRTSAMGLVRRLAGWPLVALLAVAAFVLGYLGFRLRLGADRSTADLAYLTLQLFTVESGASAGTSPPLTLEIARFLAPATTAYALGRALVRIFRTQIEHMRLRMRSGHVVVIGLGWLGLELVARLAGGDRKVVAVAIDLDDEAVAFVRRSRVPVVVGDARATAVLREARVAKASHVVVLAGDDEMNAEVALAVGALVGVGEGRPVVCLAHIRDPYLCRMLRTDAMSRHRGERLRLEFFNVAEEAAAIMLEEHAAFLSDDRPVSIGVVGGNDVAAAVISEAARTRRRHGLSPIELVLAGAGDLFSCLTTRFPQLQAGVAVDELPDGPESLDQRSIDRLAGCDAVFVCLDQDTKAIATALDMAERWADAPLVVALGQWAGMASMLAGDAGVGRKVRPFLIPDRLLDADLLLAGLGERLAREAHRGYVEFRRAGEHDPSDPSLADWRDLHEEFKESSRAQVAHLGAKLHAIGCGLAPSTDWDAPPAVLTEDEVETLAVLEHERFVAERKAAGWRPGPRDPDKKTTPFLVPWEELSDRVKDIDRAVVRLIPAMLTRAGAQMVRGHGDEGGPGGADAGRR